MSTIFTHDVPYISSLQCHMCIYNSSCELKRKQQLSIDKAEKQTNERQPDISNPSVQCRGCKLQSYCSLKHLEEDHGHRDICKVLSDLQISQNIEHPLLLNGEITSGLQHSISQLMLTVRVKLGRLLTTRERELIGNPAFCAVCFRLDKLTACSGCAAVAYCSPKHRCMDRIHHTQEVCQTLARFYSPFRMLENKLEIKHFRQRCDLERTDLVQAFNLATGIQVDSSPWQSIENYERFAACSSFSGIASICLALTHISFLAAPHEVVSVYVVGASEKHRRYFQEMHLMFFFLQYQSICQLDVYFIGHKLQPDAREEVLTLELEGYKRKVVKRTFSTTFDRFAKTRRVDPVLIIIYDPDFIDLDNLTDRLVERIFPQNGYDWRSYLLETLYTYGVPICITSPTKMQSRSNITCVNLLAKTYEIAVKCAYNCRENPYREILPYHNPCPDDNETIIYDNNYLEVIFTSKI
ncbi:uncharacterized protein LOC117782651 [Drosophila innubila]|uniref:uncharacterized protein LOC117782651 n=1 Tax=Drosophila innubila TaxID=198719 RepID=UPI00148BDD31|nr:uncharacterized protein LOC117782651 [Drosophila innubila]